MGRARRRQERVLEHLTELRSLPIGGAPEPAFRERLRAELISGHLGEGHLGEGHLSEGHLSEGHLGEQASRTERAARTPRVERGLRTGLGVGPTGPHTERRHRAERVPGRHARPLGRGRARARRRPLLSHLASFGLAAAMMISTFATYQSVPGDSLYPLKRAAESTLVRLSTDDAERGERELDSAKTRAKEVASLLGSSEDGPLVSRTLKEMEESTRSGISRLERTQPRSPKIKKFARDQREMIGPMLPQLNGDQQAQAEGYLDYIEGLAAPQ
ncbi:DUF5667 domain-containing protein [Nonomuraea sp. NPDC050783]|uniref:DUF5667 domain-containing protein n=1 Tax=Nonomuraea sp. NPDC050783 TaxID=3154634 RepID=UPI003465CBB1